MTVFVPFKMASMQSYDPAHTECETDQRCCSQKNSDINGTCKWTLFIQKKTNEDIETATDFGLAVRDRPVALSLHSRCDTHMRTPRTRCPVSGRQSSGTCSGCTWLVCWKTWRRSGDVGAGCDPATSSEPCATQNPEWHSSVPADVSRVTYTVKTQKTKTPMLK